MNEFLLQTYDMRKVVWTNQLYYPTLEEAKQGGRDMGPNVLWRVFQLVARY